MEMANTLDSSKYVYYNYVIADNSLVPFVDCSSSSNGLQADADENGAAPETTTTPTATTTTTTFTSSAQLQYPMLVQQCIEDTDIAAGLDDAPTFTLDVDTAADEASPADGHHQHHQQTTLNVVLTAAADDDAAAQLQSCAIIGSEDFEEIDEEADYEEDEIDEEEEDFECADAEDGDADEPDYESEQELTNLAWLSDLTRSSAMNMLAVAPVDADDDDDDDDDIDPDRVNNNQSNNNNNNSSAAVPVAIHKAAAGLKAAAEAPKARAKAKSNSSHEESVRKAVNDKNVTQERFNKFMQQVQQSQTVYANNELAYRSLSTEKPPFNYAQIIAMAMMEHGRMTLKDICTWIRDRFAYYRAMDNWNNSIRHNLSLHFCFTKIARDKAEKGKGGYWELSMNVTKGEKKRVRNRSKRALAAIAAAAAASAAAAAATGGDGDGGAPPELLAGAPRAKRTRRSAAMRCAPPHKAATTTFNHAAAEEEVVIMPAQLNDHVVVASELSASEAAATAVAQELCAATFVGHHGFHAAAAMPAQEVLPVDGDVDPNGHHQHNANDNEATDGNAMLYHSQILLGCEIPLSGDCIIIPYSNNGTATQQQQQQQQQQQHQQIQQLLLQHHQSQLLDAGDSIATNAAAACDAATLIAHGLAPQTCGPNVIVEQMPPYNNGVVTASAAGGSQQSVFDQVGDIERQFSSLVQMPDPDLVEYDVYFDYATDW